jgi:hypothetical protein
MKIRYKIVSSNFFHTIYIKKTIIWPFYKWEKYVSLDTVKLCEEMIKLHSEINYEKYDINYYYEDGSKDLMYYINY